MPTGFDFIFANECYQLRKTRSQLVHREPVRENPTVSEIAADFPRHQETKRDPEKDERRDIDRRKRATPQFCKKKIIHDIRPILQQRRAFFIRATLIERMIFQERRLGRRPSTK
jgi:hypothetical protein